MEGNMKLSIINFNIQNKVVNKNYDGGENAKAFSKFINKQNPDIICLQELTDTYENRLKTFMPNYHFTGENRFNKKSIWYSHFGEKNAITTNLKIIKTKTYSLSKNINKIGKRSLLSIFPRIATVTTITKEKRSFTVINTHLDHLTNTGRKTQLIYLKQIIELNNNYPIILTGDFNLNTESKLFQEFVKYMQTKNCKLVPVEEKTFKPPVNPFKISYNFKTPDHIFIPKEFIIENVDVIDNVFSDHKLIKIKIKK